MIFIAFYSFLCSPPCFLCGLPEEYVTQILGGSSQIIRSRKKILIDEQDSLGFSSLQMWSSWQPRIVTTNVQGWLIHINTICKPKAQGPSQKREHWCKIVSCRYNREVKPVNPHQYQQQLACHMYRVNNRWSIGGAIQKQLRKSIYFPENEPPNDYLIPNGEP